METPKSKENWSDKVGRLLSVVKEDVEKKLAENTTISKEMREKISFAIDVDTQDVASEILDSSVTYAGMNTKDQIRRLLIDRILRAVGTENVYPEGDRTAPVADFLKQAVL